MNSTAPVLESLSTTRPSGERAARRLTAAPRARTMDASHIRTGSPPSVENKTGATHLAAEYAAMRSCLRAGPAQPSATTVTTTTAQHAVLGRCRSQPFSGIAPLSLPNTGDKLRASSMLNARQLHPLVRRRRSPLGSVVRCVHELPDSREILRRESHRQPQRDARHHLCLGHPPQYASLEVNCHTVG